MFIRKTSSVIDHNLYQLLPVDHPEEIPYIRWPSGGVKASEVPNWEKEKLALMKGAAKRAKKDGEKLPAHFEKEMERLEKDGERKEKGAILEGSNDQQDEDL